LAISNRFGFESAARRSCPRRGYFWRIVAVTVFAAVSAAPTPTAAFELFGKCLFGACRSSDDDTLIDPKRYEVTVEVLTDGQSDGALEKAVRNASLIWQGRKEPAAGSAGLLTRAKADYRRILAALYNEARIRRRNLDKLGQPRDIRAASRHGISR
jgi:outer membrane translocation and assembly module TamA